MSYYRIAKTLELDPGTVLRWKAGKAGMGRDVAMRVAELLDEPPAYILACIEHEREPSAGVRRIWKQIAEAFRSKAAAVGAIILIGLAGAGSPAPSEACGDSLFTPDIDYTKRRRRLRWPWSRDLFGAWLTWLPLPAAA